MATPSPVVRQASFLGGEIDPQLYGRTDHPKYPSAARTMLNFIATQQGAAKNRPGTKFIARVKNYAVSPRLIPFFWPSQNYVLEFGDKYLRIFSNGGQVLSTPTVPYEIATPFTAAMLPYLKFAQKDDRLTIDYGGQDVTTTSIAPQELRRVSHLIWTINPISYAVSAPGFAPLGINGFVSIPDATHPTKDWQWQVTLLYKDALGNGFETSAQTLFPGPWDGGIGWGAGTVVRFGGHDYTSLQNANTGHQPDQNPTWWARGIVVFPDKPVNIVGDYSSFVGGFANVISAEVYRGKEGVFGYVGSSAPGSGNVGGVPGGNTFGFTDDGATPDYSLQPPKSTNPFVAGDYPSCVAYFQQRRVFARQPNHLARIQGSRVGRPSNFDVSLIVQDDDALNFDLASSTLEEIRSLVSLRALIALTNTGVTVIRGSGSLRSGGVGLSPSSIDATRQSSRGASWVDPVVVDNTIVFAQAKGSAVRALTYNPYWEVLDQPGTDIGIVGQHLLRSHAVVDMAYQESPDSIIWCVREDGVLLGLTFVPSAQPDNQIYGWHQHVTDGSVEHICCVPEGSEDAVYMVVRRVLQGATVRYVERMASRNIPLITVQAEPVTLSTGAVVIRGSDNGVTVRMIISSLAVGAIGELYAGNSANLPFLPTDIGATFRFDPDGANGGPFNMVIVSYLGPTNVLAQLVNPLALQYAIGQSPDWSLERVAGTTDVQSQTRITREDPRFGVFLDSALSFDGRVGAGQSALVFTPDAGTFNGGEEGILWMPTWTPQSPSIFGATDVGDQIVVDLEGTKGGPVRLSVLSFINVSQVRARLDGPASLPLQAELTLGTLLWAWARRIMIGVDHLSNRSVLALVDGQVQGPFYVSNGTIALETPGVIVTAGLPYTSDLELLDISPTAVKANVKSVTRAFIEVVASRGLWVGERADALSQWQQREVKDSFAAIQAAASAVVDISLKGSTWNRGGRVFIRQTDPLPLTVNAVGRELEIGGP